MLVYKKCSRKSKVIKVNEIFVLVNNLDWLCYSNE